MTDHWLSQVEGAPRLHPPQDDAPASHRREDDSPASHRREDLPLDAHLHTELSPDSEVPIDVSAAAAAERGIAELAVTDHLDLRPGRPAFEYATHDRRERYVREAAERWAGRVAIRFGAEITYETECEADVREHLAHHSYDYTIGSVHVYRGSVYEAHNVASWVAGRSFHEIVAPYFSEVEAAARSGLFDTLGHLDYVKRYLAAHIPPSAFAAAAELYDPVLRALVDSGMALEVNTSGLRQAAAETYPSPAIVARFRELGGQRVTIGSDAHRPSWFAFGLAEGYAAVAEAGFDELAFRRGGVSPVAIAMPQPAPGRARPNSERDRSL